MQPLHNPAYLLIVADAVLEVALPVPTPYDPIGFPFFLYLLAIVGADDARPLRGGSGNDLTPVRVGAGVLLVTGVLSVRFGLVVGGSTRYSDR